jgi:hypothetical protein
MYDSIPDLCRAALACARAGYAVFPCEPNGKAPLTNICPNGYLDATTDESIISSWWERYPYANIGFPCAPNGVIVIDPDRNKRDRSGNLKPDGVQAYRSLPGWQPSPPGPKAQTPSGGVHLFYAAPELAPGESIKGKIVESIDIKFNGYVLVAPSIADGKPYNWVERSSDGTLVPGVSILDVPPPPLPEWSRSHVVATGATPSTEKTVAVRTPSTEERSLVSGALACIPADDRDLWIKVGMALKAGGYELCVWEDWSRTSGEYEPGDCIKEWASFKRSGIALGTLFHYAKDYGFKFPPGRHGLDHIGNAQRFIDEYGGSVLWYPAKKSWLIFGGQRWELEPIIFGVVE